MSGYCDVPEFYATSEPVARKQHKCCECKAPILIGEKHVYCRGKWDGELSTYRQHSLCCQACEWIRDKLGDGGCIGFGMLNEEFGEIRHDYDKDHQRMKPLRDMMARILWRERKARA